MEHRLIDHRLIKHRVIKLIVSDKSKKELQKEKPYHPEAFLDSFKFKRLEKNK